MGHNLTSLFNSGTGISVAVATEFDLETADFVDLTELTPIIDNDSTEDMSFE